MGADDGDDVALVGHAEKKGVGDDGTSYDTCRWYEVSDEIFGVLVGHWENARRRREGGAVLWRCISVRAWPSRRAKILGQERNMGTRQMNNLFSMYHPGGTSSFPTRCPVFLLIF